MPPPDKSLPWKSLASRFEPSFVRLNAAKIALTPSDITFIPDEETRIQIRAFVRSFAEALDKDMQSLKKTIPAPDEADELFISDGAARRIAPTIKRLRSVDKKPEYDRPHREVYCMNTSRLCTHGQKDDACVCLVPLWTRHVTPLWDFYEGHPRDRYREDYSIGHDYTLALLLHEEIVPVLKIHKLLEQEKLPDGRHHPRYSYRSVFYRAMLSFMALNLLLEMPATWDAGAKTQPWHDYRDTAFYQIMMAAICCGEVGWEAQMSAWPHNSFFDVPDDKWPLMPWLKKAKSRLAHRLVCNDQLYGKYSRVAFGALPFDRFVASRKGIRRRLAPGERDMDEDEARVCLRRRGMPVEIVNMIVDMAKFDEENPWRLEVQDDPLHPENRKALKSYLDYCWRLMVCSRIAWEDSDTYGTAANHSERLALEALLRLGCKNERSNNDNRYECNWCLAIGDREDWI